MKRCPSCQATLPADYTHCPRDGTALVSVAEWAEGSMIRGKYRIIAKIGEGGMASVYKALHTRFNEVRALKVISPELASDANFVRRFEQEAIVTRKLQHPNAVRVDDIDEAEDGRPFIVMEYVEGRSLKEVIEQEAPMSMPRVCAIVQQAAAALDAAHAVGLVHRDIKPGNIALASTTDTSGVRSEQVKILDFGIAKLREAHLLDTKTRSVHLTLTDTGMMIGTPAYMSPEQARGMRGDQLDGRSDIYSLGVVMYQMLAGELPLKADSTLEQLMAHLNTPPRPIREVRPDLPAEVAAVVMRCLEKSRELRPANGHALVDELQAAMNPPAPPRDVPSPVIMQSAVAPAPEPSRTATPSPDKTASIPVEVPSISLEGRRTVPTHAWLWAAIAVFIVAAVSIAYFLRAQPAAEKRPDVSAKVISPTVPPQPAGHDSKPPSPPAVSPESTDANPTQPADAPAKAAAQVPQAHNEGSATKPSFPPRHMPTKPPSTLPAVSNANSPKASTVVAQPAASQSSMSLPGPGTSPVSGVSAAGANPPATHPASALSAATSGGATGNQNPATEPVYHVGAGVSAPSILSAPQPDYTDDASRARKQGNCVLSVVVDTSGRARNIRVVTPLGFGLDEKAIEAVQRWRFQPGSKDGKPVNVQINIEVEFRQY